MMDAWYDDPCFDDTHEVIDGKVVRGDAWRRAMMLREEAARRAVKLELVSVAGVTFRENAVRECVNEGATGAEVHLQWEERDDDTLATQVYVGDKMIGYLPKAMGERRGRVFGARVLKAGMEPVSHVWLFAESIE